MADRWQLPIIHFFRIHIMMKETEPGEIPPFSPWNAIVAVGIDGKTAAGEKFAPHFDIPRAQETDEVRHDHIHAVFMKIAVIAIAEKIQFQRFAFHHVFVRNIGNINGGKVRLSRLRAEAREFRTVEFDEEIPVRMLVGDFFQKGGIIIIGILRILIAQLFQLI